MQGVAPTTAQPQYEITAADKKRQELIARAWQAFEDDLEPPLIPMDDEDPETANVAENIVSSCVEDIISFLFGDELEIRVEEGAPDGAQELLDEVWGRKESRLPLLQELAQNGILSGQAFLRIVPNRDGSLRLVVVDPYNVFIRNMQGDCKTVTLYCIEYYQEETANGKTVKHFYREEIQRLDPQMDDPDSQSIELDQDTSWEIQHWTRQGDKGLWQAVGEPIVWPYSYCPIQSCQNLVRANSFWGRPDTTKGLIALNKIINFVLSNINKIIKLYAQPWPWIKGARLPSDAEMGRVTELPPDAEMGVLDFHSDLANSLIFIDKLHGVVERLTSVPALASGVSQSMPTGPISGIALKTQCMALLKKIDKKRNLYGKLIIDTSKAILQLNGFAPEIDITLHWQSPLPANILEDLQAAILKEQVGYSKDTTLRELGADPEHEAELKKAEAEEAMVNFSRGTGLPPATQPGQEQEKGEEQ